jgi:TDG/mug DNA glycosylase family protein
MAGEAELTSNPFTAFAHVPTSSRDLARGSSSARVPTSSRDQARGTSKRPLSEAAEAPCCKSARAGGSSSSDDALQPFVAAEAGGFRERYTSISLADFKARRPSAEQERPLRVLLVGHNPSEHAWQSGVPYSNPTNRFWRLLRDAGVLPRDWRAEPEPEPVTIANCCAGELGLGITDFFLSPGSDAQTFGRRRMLDEREGFYRRLRAHRRRAGAAPRIVAFVGKRQWEQCFEPPLKSVPTVRQAARPPGWPYNAEETQVFVLTSPSGRAVVDAEERRAEFAELGAAMSALPWPLPALG